MPKDEFDSDDPLELSGVAMLTREDTTHTMCECFIEEFMRMGYGRDQILALFRNPFYLGLNMVLQRHGEDFVRARLSDVFARWGRPGRVPAYDPPAGQAKATAETTLPNPPQPQPRPQP